MNKNPELIGSLVSLVSVSAVKGLGCRGIELGDLEAPIPMSRRRELADKGSTGTRCLLDEGCAVIPNGQLPARFVVVCYHRYAGTQDVPVPAEETGTRPSISSRKRARLPALLECNLGSGKCRHLPSRGMRACQTRTEFWFRRRKGGLQANLATEKAGNIKGTMGRGRKTMTIASPSGRVTTWDFCFSGYQRREEKMCSGINMIGTSPPLSDAAPETVRVAKFNVLSSPSYIRSSLLSM